MNTTTKRLVSELTGKPVPRRRRGRHRTPGPLTRLYARIWAVLVR